MNQLRDELLARPGLPEDMHRGLASRHARDHLAQGLHGRGSADETRPLHGERGCAVGARPQLEGACDELAQDPQIERLGDEIEGAEFQSADR